MIREFLVLEIVMKPDEDVYKAEDIYIYRETGYLLSPYSIREAEGDPIARA